MTNQDVLKIAMTQSAIDSTCCYEDFACDENRIVISKETANARKYLELPFLCDFTSYGSNIVASVSEMLQDVVSEYMSKFPVPHCFETPNLHFLIEKLKPYGVNVCFMAEYFLPNVDNLVPIECNYETKLLTEADFANLYLPQWSNALCLARKQLDKLAVGAYHNGNLIGLAGCSADCDTMWQIGIDVLPEYRRQGIACALTNKLAIEIIQRDIVPFYCCAWSNLKSVRNAIKSGFLPAWVQMTVKTSEFIEERNR